MTFTWQRWLASLVIGCAVIAVTFLPEREDNFAWREFLWARSASNTNSLRVVERARGGHAYRLLSVRAAWLDLAEAQQAFGGMRAPGSGAQATGTAARATGGDVPIIYAAGAASASAATRDRIASIVRTERAGLHARGAAPVGVVVARSDELSFSMPSGSEGVGRYMRSSSARRMILPRESTGGRCVIVVRLNAAALNGTAQLPTGPILGGCAFFDAFGSPGRGVSEAFAGTNIRAMSAYDPSMPELPWGGRLYLNWDDLWTVQRAGRCSMGDEKACLALMPDSSSKDRFGNSTFGFEDRTAAAPSGLSQQLRTNGAGDDAKLLGSIARDLGPQRFAQLWRSDRPFADAYFDASGQTLGRWWHDRIVRDSGVYRAGPWNSPLSSSLTLLFIALCGTLAVRFSPRPRAS